MKIMMHNCDKNGKKMMQLYRLLLFEQILLVFENDIG